MHSRCVRLSEINNFSVGESRHIGVVVFVFRHVFFVEDFEVLDTEKKV